MSGKARRSTAAAPSVEAPAASPESGASHVAADRFRRATLEEGPDAAALKPTDVFEDHLATLVAMVANRLTRGASDHYRRMHGIGVMEMRILLALRKMGDLSAFEIAHATDLDKAAVSRSMRVLERLGYIRIVRTGKADRRVVAITTDSGRVFQEQLHAIQQARQDAYLEGFSPEELDQFWRMLPRLFDRVVAVDKAAKHAP
jgi:DNA-binding MarR family transcriptional regulator